MLTYEEKVVMWMKLAADFRESASKATKPETRKAYLDLAAAYDHLVENAQSLARSGVQTMSKISLKEKQ